MKQILVIDANPVPGSLSSSLATAYQQGAEKAGATCRLVHLHELKFNLNLGGGYHNQTELEPDLLNMQQYIREADHLVFVYPIWWGTFPALLKGFIDRVFLPGFAFKYRENSPFWDKLLSGKSARLITTMDAPNWYFRFITGKPGHNAIKKATLQFCGVSPVRVTSFNPIKRATPRQIQLWLGQVEKLGQDMG